MVKDDCIFCKLANGVIPTASLYEDDTVSYTHLTLADEYLFV